MVYWEYLGIEKICSVKVKKGNIEEYWDVIENLIYFYLKGLV